MSQSETETEDNTLQEENGLDLLRYDAIHPSGDGEAAQLSNRSNKNHYGFHQRGPAASRYLTFSLGFSLLLVAGGGLILLFSLPSLIAFFPGLNILGIRLSVFEGYVFSVIGILLLVGPLFFNRFVSNAVKYERDLRIQAQKSSREAQLLQDILTHDVRNYNQVSKLSAELLAEEFKETAGSRELIEKLLESIDGSTLLVERAKMLGRVISDFDFDRRPVNVLSSIKRSMDLIIAATPDRTVNAVVKLDSEAVAPIATLDPAAHPVEVLADDLLEEVFANLFSNSLKYSKGEVFIGVEISAERPDKKLKRDCWKISISDTGNGIPDDLKDSLFSRYLEGAKGSGLGLSIVHALVVGRYFGRIEVGNRVGNDHTKGTLIEVTLPAAGVV